MSNRSIAVLASLLIAITLTGCTNRLMPPRNLAEPVYIHLMDHGRHPSLILPGPEGGWVRYVHGEWRWYAKDEKGTWRALQAFFWPTRATIGRRQLTRLPREGEFSEEIPEGFVSIHSMSVEKSRMLSLHTHLDQFFQSPGQMLYQPRYNLEFVPYPSPYTVFNNSNHEMAQWLEWMAVEVQGSAYFSDWDIGTEAGEP